MMLIQVGHLSIEEYEADEELENKLLDKAMRLTEGLLLRLEGVK